MKRRVLDKIAALDKIAIGLPLIKWPLGPLVKEKRIGQKSVGFRVFTFTGIGSAAAGLLGKPIGKPCKRPGPGPDPWGPKAA